jgi:hypothetical protein
VIDFDKATGGLAFVAVVFTVTPDAALPVFGTGLRRFCAFACVRDGAATRASAAKTSKVETEERREENILRIEPRSFISSVLTLIFILSEI